MKTQPGELLKSIRSEEHRAGKGDPVVTQKARMLAAHRRGSSSEAWQAMQQARELGASWEELAWALDMCAPDTEQGYRSGVTSVLTKGPQ